MSESLRTRSFKALIWAFLQQGGSQLIRFVFSILLARQLSPEDYGLMGLALLVYNFLQVISRFGLGEGLVQAGRLNAARQTTLLLAHGLFSLLGAALCWLAAAPVAAWYEAPGLEPMIRLLSLSFIFSIGVIVPRARLEKDLRFDTVTRRALPASLLASITALAAAHAGWGATSLILLVLVEQLALAIGLLPWLPRSRPAPARELAPVLRYSWKLSLAGIFGFIGKNLDTALIGKWIGKTELGFYNLGFRLTRLPAQNLAAVLDRVLFPAFSSIKDDKPRIASAYGRALRALSLLVIPSFTLVLFMVAPLVPRVLGDTWQAAVPVMQVFCLLAMVQTMGRSMNAVIQALGRSDIVLMWVFLSAPANMLAVWFSASQGITAVAWTLLAVRLAIHLFQLIVVTRLLGRGWFELLGKEAAGLPAAILISLLMWGLKSIAGAESLFLPGAALLLGAASVVTILVIGPRVCWRWLNGEAR
jgi:O-antigen/teichoic acid export membrane protein